MMLNLHVNRPKKIALRSEEYNALKTLPKTKGLSAFFKATAFKSFHYKSFPKRIGTLTPSNSKIFRGLLACLDYPIGILF